MGVINYHDSTTEAPPPEPKKKHIFRIWYRITTLAYVDIKDVDFTAAVLKAEEMGGDRFHKVDDMEWSLDKDLTVTDNLPEAIEAREKGV